MAVVTRYFGVTANAAGDGTTWNDRAALFTGGAWSTVITGFNFSGSDSLKCLVGPGTHTITVGLASASFANPPTATNPLFLCGCDSSGNPLAIPDPDWVSAMPAWDASGLPVLNTTSNIFTFNLGTVHLHLLNLTASGRNGAIIGTVASVGWCHATNSTANTSAVVSIAVAHYFGCVFKCSGSSYDVIFGASPISMNNCRIEGVTGSSGNRRGMSTNGAAVIQGCTIVNNGGEGVISVSVSTALSVKLSRCTIANNGATGFKGHATAAQSVYYELFNSIVTGNGAFGVDAQSESNVVMQGCRLRDNASGNTNGFDNYPTDLNNFTTDSDDATEYVSTGANGDFRIKNTAAIWGQGYGAGDQAASAGGGGGPLLNGRLIQ